MKRYIRLDIEQFLKDSRHSWTDEIKSLEQKKEEILPLKAIGNSEVHSGNISHPAEDTAMQILRIDEEIERIHSYRAILDKALEWLDADEMILIDGFYFSNRTINAFVDEYCITNGCETRTVYNRKRAATESLRRIIEEAIEDMAL